MFRRGFHAAFILIALGLLPGCSRRVTVGSKAFTESVLLGDIAVQLMRSDGTDAVSRPQLGGTRLVWDALVKGEIDAYPEYTGTLRNEIFAGEDAASPDRLRELLAARGIEMTPSLGFSDGYALGMEQSVADRLHIRTLSDLRQHPELRFGFSNEFMDRRDGWRSLRDAYGLHPAQVTGLEHEPAYRALAAGAIDVTDLYSTDADIADRHLLVLQDDLHYFPAYDAVFLYRADLKSRAPAAIASLEKLAGKISAERMIAMNARAKFGKVPESQVAGEFLASTFNLPLSNDESGFWRRLAETTWQHLELVSVSLAAAIVLGIPLGVLAASFPRAGQFILGAVAAIYTIPALALLVFMIPVLGIGWMPAVVALFLYSLLPIVRNTHAGLTNLSRPVRESAAALGLPPWARLTRVELPLAFPSILAGVQTSAVLNVGTATLGALIGAGGYGQPILSGIRLDRPSLILEGAIPAALLALIVQGGFEWAGRWILPKGMRSGRNDC